MAMAQIIIDDTDERFIKGLGAKSR